MFVTLMFAKMLSILQKLWQFPLEGPVVEGQEELHNCKYLRDADTCHLFSCLLLIFRQFDEGPCGSFGCIYLMNGSTAWFIT